MTCSPRPLFPHQQVAIDALRSTFANGVSRIVLQAPTGYGKTVLAAHIVHGARSKSKRVTFAVPAIGLIDQTFERFVENGIDPADMGVIQGNHPWRRPGAPIQIASAQTLARRSFPETDLVVIDECHIRHKVYDRWMAEQPSLRFVGLSATPWSPGLGKLYGALLKPTSLGELIEHGFLSPFRVFAPSHPDLSGVSTVAGDYHEGELGEAMDKPQLVADIVATWLVRGEDRPTLCFAVNRAHARSITERFAEAGVPCAYVDANTPREERTAIGERLASGAVKVVCNVGCLTTGIDWDVRCIILARPTKSEALFVQIIGRALRTAEGKADAIILDHSDTHLRLGMVTDIDHDELDDGRARTNNGKRREKSIPLPKECGSCTALIPPLMQSCPSCGASAPRPTFSEGDGELDEFRPRQKGKKGGSVTETIRAMGKASVYAQLKQLQIEGRRKPGWIYHTFVDIFGVKPKGLDGVAYEEPHPVLRSFIRAKRIRFERAQAKIAAAASEVSP